MVRRHNVPAIVVNQVGGNDQIVFDGTSFAMDAEGNVIASAASFARRSGDRRHRHRRGRSPCESPRRMRSGLRSARAGYARLHPQVRLQTGSDRPERRHRFLAHRGDCGGCGGPRECARRRHARAVFFRPQHCRRARSGRAARHRLRHRFRSRRHTTRCCARWRRSSTASSPM